MPRSDGFDDVDALVDLLRTSRDELVAGSAAAASAIADALASGGRCLAFGNGGSAADAQHLVAELVGHFRTPRPPFSAVAIGTDPATTTSIGNDLGYGAAFERQVQALCRPGDAVVAISTSGTSANVVAAAGAARAAGATVVALTADGGRDLALVADVVVDVASTDTQRIQEVHGLCIHLIVGEVERLLGVSDAD